MRAMRSASMKPRVSSLSARWSEITSARASSASRSTSGTPRIGPRGAVPGDHLHADAARDARDLAADAAEPDHAERLADELHAFERLPGAGAHRAVHAREVAAAGEHQRDGVLGDRGVAVALDGVHLTPSAVQRRHVHVARGAGAEEHDVLEALALRDQFGRHVGMVVEADVVAGEQARQVVGSERLGVDRDRRVVGPVHAGKDRRRAGCCSR